MALRHRVPRKVSNQRIFEGFHRDQGRLLTALTVHPRASKVKDKRNGYMDLQQTISQEVSMLLLAAPKRNVVAGRIIQR